MPEGLRTGWLEAFWRWVCSFSHFTHLSSFPRLLLISQHQTQLRSPYLAVGNSEMEAGSDLAFNELQAWCAERRLTGRQLMNDAGVP